MKKSIVSIEIGATTLFAISIRARKTYQLFRFKDNSGKKEAVGKSCLGSEIREKLREAKRTGSYDGEVLQTNYCYELQRTRCVNGSSILQESTISRTASKLPKATKQFV